MECTVSSLISGEQLRGLLGKPLAEDAEVRLVMRHAVVGFNVAVHGDGPDVDAGLSHGRAAGIAEHPEAELVGQDRLDDQLSAANKVILELEKPGGALEMWNGKSEWDKNLSRKMGTASLNS